MADQEHLRIVKEGWRAVARWRREHPEERLDLIEADLSKAKLNGADLTFADLTIADLTEADLTGADLSMADLSGADLTKANLTRADLSEAICRFTTFADCNLKECHGLESIKHEYPSSVGIDTIILSFRGAGNRLTPELETFFLGTGVPKELLAELPRILAGIQYYTCFISYGEPDKAFADRLESDLKAKKVQCWKYDKDAVIGQDVEANIERSIQRYDKVIVICSKNSLDRPAVLNEIERALQKEDRLRQENAQRTAEAREKGVKPQLLDADVLCPVRLDDYVIQDWQHPRKASVRRKHIGDFYGWQNDPNKYQEELAKLLHALDPKTWPPV